MPNLPAVVTTFLSLEQMMPYLSGLLVVLLALWGAADNAFLVPASLIFLQLSTMVSYIAQKV